MGFYGVIMVGNPEFARFVQKLRSISTETDAGEFLRKLLYKIGPKEDLCYINKIARCPLSTLHQYYSGEMGISGAFFDFEYDKPGFESYLEDLSDSQVEQLVDAFITGIPEINLMNLSQVLPDKLGRILANRKKRGPKRNTSSSGQSGGQQFLNFNAPNQDNQYKLSRESMNHCEYPDCPKILYDTDNPNVGPLCEVVFIDENATNKDDDSNLAVMCPDCARKYKNGHSPEIVAGVRKRKDDLLHEFNSMLRLSERKLTEGAEILLRNVQNLPGIKAKFPETFPTDIENKIKPEYRDLLVKLGPLSSTYFVPCPSLTPKPGPRISFVTSKIRKTLHIR